MQCPCFPLIVGQVGQSVIHPSHFTLVYAPRTPASCPLIPALVPPPLSFLPIAHPSANAARDPTSRRQPPSSLESSALAIKRPAYSTSFSPHQSTDSLATSTVPPLILPRRLKKHPPSTTTAAVAAATAHNKKALTGQDAKPPRHVWRQPSGSGRRGPNEDPCRPPATPWPLTGLRLLLKTVPLPQSRQRRSASDRPPGELNRPVHVDAGCQRHLLRRTDDPRIASLAFHAIGTLELRLVPATVCCPPLAKAIDPSVSSRPIATPHIRSPNPRASLVHETPTTQRAAIDTPDHRPRCETDPTARGRASANT
ncbi:hypothetical protein JDV02_008319 [Purpureocillium takamizusanense]|uniref:Uncharacterized protein n=1 Tax=Purpureocillium takamizusanense TaxID=2060973 RepID=A0A9Q8VE95_9HYPO|nr:uncharacterized protein JDV02_008319 [Purpureocillium takamizusanense]UNI22428.1 hypothetical protein JDV02_008319 [Purpureocillium takamizusanense]